MANLNRVFLIGRLTRDPEFRTFSNGGKVAKFGFAVNNRKKNTQTGQWEDEPVWLNCEAVNRGAQGTLADRIERNCRKGTQLYLECHLQLDSWTTQQGEKRSQLKLVVDNLQLLDSRQGGGEGGDEGGYSGGAKRYESGRPPAYDEDMPPSLNQGNSPRGNFAPESDLPF
jgi:single-strand DNA-binding protein